MSQYEMMLERTNIPLSLEEIRFCIMGRKWDGILVHLIAHPQCIMHLLRGCMSGMMLTPPTGSGMTLSFLLLRIKKNWVSTLFIVTCSKHLLPQVKTHAPTRLHNLDFVGKLDAFTRSTPMAIIKQKLLDMIDSGSIDISAEEYYTDEMFELLSQLVSTQKGAEVSGRPPSMEDDDETD